MAGSGHLRPGEKGRIIARFAPLSGKGVVAEKIEVSSNDPARPKVVLTMRANVIENIPLPLR